MRISIVFLIGILASIPALGDHPCFDIYLWDGEIIRGVHLYRVVNDGETYVVYWRTGERDKSKVLDSDVTDILSGNCVTKSEKKKQDDQQAWNEMIRISQIKDYKIRMEEWKKIKCTEIQFCGKLQMSKSAYSTNPKIELTTRGPDGTDEERRVEVEFRESERIKFFNFPLKEVVLCVSAKVEKCAPFFSFSGDLTFEDGVIISSDVRNMDFSKKKEANEECIFGKDGGDGGFCVRFV